MAKIIELTKGQVAIVDDEDYETLSKFNWCLNGALPWGYAVRRVKKKLLLMHRVILNAPDGVEVDHKNGNCLDNRRCNLRLCTHGENAMNRRKLRPTASRFKGVSRTHNGTWRAFIGYPKWTHLGVFETQEEAALCYDERARELFGEFARLNFPVDTSEKPIN